MGAVQNNIKSLYKAWRLNPVELTKIHREHIHTYVNDDKYRKKWDSAIKNLDTGGIALETALLYLDSLNGGERGKKYYEKRSREIQ